MSDFVAEAMRQQAQAIRDAARIQYPRKRKKLISEISEISEIPDSRLVLGCRNLTSLISLAHSIFKQVSKEFITESKEFITESFSAL